MTAGTRVGPTACVGLEMRDAQGVPYKHRVHCNGCADAAALREQLAEARQFASDTLRDTKRMEQWREDERVLRQRLERQVESLDREQELRLDETLDLRTRLATAEALALANEERATRAEALLERWGDDALIDWRGSPTNGDDGRWVFALDSETVASLIDDTQEWLDSRVAAPTEPDGASGTKGDDVSTTLINELMMAADAWAQLANLTLPGLPPEASQQLYAERMVRSERLRQRAAWVRHWGERLVAYRDNPNLPVDNMIGPFTVSIFTMLTGPIPAAETAPTERKP